MLIFFSSSYSWFYAIFDSRIIYIYIYNTWIESRIKPRIGRKKEIHHIDRDILINIDRKRKTLKLKS